jgi:hypothetical protein
MVSVICNKINDQVFFLQRAGFRLWKNRLVRQPGLLPHKSNEKKAAQELLPEQPSPVNSTFIDYSTSTGPEDTG